MVAKTVPLPNIRKLFIPDPGYMICDCDLAQADARVVAWEAGDEKLKAVFRDPTKDLHNENATDIFGSLTPAGRKLAKAGVHAVNYFAQPPRLAAALGITLTAAQAFYDGWFAKHPEIKAWHERIQAQLSTTRTVSNAFGFRRFYFDHIANLLPEALAWIPQSTVAIAINKGILNIHNNLPEVQLLLQTHDSATFQFKKSLFPAILPSIREQLLVTIPYPDPLIIPVSCEVSTKSWGEVYPVHWDTGESIK